MARFWQDKIYHTYPYKCYLKFQILIVAGLKGKAARVSTCFLLVSTEQFLPSLYGTLIEMWSLTLALGFRNPPTK